MNCFKNLVVVLIITLMGCEHKSAREQFVNDDNDLSNPDVKWILSSPTPSLECELWLSFKHDGKMILGYKGAEHEGYYEIDSTLTHYVTMNVFNKQGWDNQCPVNPQYLSLYDDDTQFSYKIIDDQLYFQKNEKVITFERFSKEQLSGNP